MGWKNHRGDEGAGHGGELNVGLRAAGPPPIDPEVVADPGPPTPRKCSSQDAHSGSRSRCESRPDRRATPTPGEEPCRRVRAFDLPGPGDGSSGPSSCSSDSNSPGETVSASNRATS